MQPENQASLPINPRPMELSDDEHAALGVKSSDYPYLPPSIRADALELFNQFLGAVRTRIASRQKALWSRFIGAGFIEQDIETVWPERNMRFVAIKHGGDFRNYNIEDLNLRELDELESWLSKRFTQPKGGQ